jgi:hypothetical protein
MEYPEYLQRVTSLNFPHYHFQSFALFLFFPILCLYGKGEKAQGIGNSVPSVFPSLLKKHVLRA